ncbi:MAG: thioredoxin domain-containing protein, partial [Nitrospirae bacterium]|nr:thioredoxin domain-containing protein [Nitrospirota bacterium]
PVNWYPWSEAAFSKAKEEDKPVFLSIGYSTCHWCHVMKRESFEDVEVARLLNDTFISIKLDREERPDIDSIYMTVCQMITGRGGWPLTIMMFPEGRPFYAATYIPKTGRDSTPGMLELIPQIKNIWRQKRSDLIRIAEKITEKLNEPANHSYRDSTTSSELTAKTYRALETSFDNENGGFSRAPKFPTPHNILFLLRYYFETGTKSALHMVEKTLYAMRMGGMYDHIGHGFHRYSTDSRWHVPHFEKMLYDQALLAMAYTEAYQVTRNPFYEKTAREILTYVLRDMRSSEGAFYCAEDAESQGQEGLFYLWRYDDIVKLLNPDESKIVTEFFNVKVEGNFHDELTGALNGMNILYMVKTPSTQAESDLLESAVKKLYNERIKRIPPGKDDKILTDLNGLMAAALAIAGRAFSDDSFIKAAKDAVLFIETAMATETGALYHRFRDGQSAIDSTINDYAALTWALIELYETTFESTFLTKARKYMDFILDNFWDDEASGFYFTSKTSETLIARQKELYDAALPSGNSISLYNMLKLCRLIGSHTLEEKALTFIDAFYGKISEQPAAYTFFILAAGLALGKRNEIVVAGNADEAVKILNILGQHFLPNSVFVLKSTDSSGNNPADYTADMSDIDGKPAIYICTDNACQKPVTDLSEALSIVARP